MAGVLHSESWPGLSQPPTSFLGDMLQSGAQDHPIAVEPHFVGAKLFGPVQAMLAGGEIERPVVPRAADHLAVGDQIALADRRALVDAAIGDRVDPAVAAKHRDRSGSGPER